MAESFKQKDDGRVTFWMACPLERLGRRDIEGAGGQ
jgi:hypothetical protein